jgi:hypothetical protein
MIIKLLALHTFSKIRSTPCCFLHIPPAVIEYVDAKLADKDAAA